MVSQAFLGLSSPHPPRGLGFCGGGAPVGIFAPFTLSLLILGPYAVPVGIKTWGRPWSCLAEPDVFRPIGG